VRLEDSPSPVYGAALLMRLGVTTLRGSNPRSSALTSSFARKIGPDGLLFRAVRGPCVAITVAGLFSTPAMTRAARAQAMSRNLPDHPARTVGRDRAQARSGLLTLRSARPGRGERLAGLDGGLAA
jgi:hypothetical protein